MPDHISFGLSGDVGASTVGTLFVSLPTAFFELGAVGSLIGVFFFITLLVAGLTSSISLLEVSVASMVDRFRMSRRLAVCLSTVFAGGLGILPAFNQEWLVLMDKLASEYFVVIGALASLLLARKLIARSPNAVASGSGLRANRFMPVIIFLIRWVAPAVVCTILITTIVSQLAD